MPQAAIAKRPPGPVHRRGLKDAKRPLVPIAHELFAQMLVEGVPIQTAYERAGFKGGEKARRQLRNHPDIKARVSWLLEQRIDSATKRRHRAEKPIADLRARTMKELERVAFSDVRDVIQWRTVPIIDSDGSIVGYKDEVVATPSHSLTRDQAAQIKEISTKSGTVRIATHDKLAALDKIARALGLFQETAPPPSNVNVQQINVGNVAALELARRLAFVLAVAGSQQPGQQLDKAEPVTIEAKPVDQTR